MNTDILQDSDMQAPIHHGLWTNTVQNVVERNERTIHEMFEARFRAEFGE